MSRLLPILRDRGPLRNLALAGLCLLLLVIYRCGSTGFDKETDVRIAVEGLNGLTVPASIRGGQSVTLTADINRVTTERSFVEWEDGGIAAAAGSGGFSNINSPTTRWTAPENFNGEATIILRVFKWCTSVTDPNCPQGSNKGLLLNSKVIKFAVSTFTAYDFFLGQGVRFDPSSRVVTSFDDTRVGDDGPEVIILEFFDFHYILKYFSYVQHHFTLNLIGPDQGIRHTFEGDLDPRLSGVNVTLGEQTEGNTAGTLSRGTWRYELLIDGVLLNPVMFSRTFTALREGDDFPFFSSLVTAKTDSVRKVTAGESIVLDGSGSTGTPNRPLYFRWTIIDQPENSNPSLSNIDTMFPTFKADVKGTYVVQLVVSDGVNTSRPAIVTITVNKATTTPIAVIAGGDRTVTVNTVVNLDGSDSSDPNGDSITYSWSFVSKPSTSSASLSNTSGQISSFTPDVTGEYFVQLTVSDGTESDTETVKITANP